MVAAHTLIDRHPAFWHSADRSLQSPALVDAPQPTGFDRWMTEGLKHG